MKSISRRRFMGDALLTAAAASAATSGLWLPASVRAQDAKKVSANEKFGVAIVGCGGRAGSHIGELLADGRSEILYLCDPDLPRAENRAKDIEKKTGRKPKVVADMREAFADPAVDVVTCASANHWHALCGVWAMQAGKHVYLEKPISHNIHEGKALIAAAKKYGVMCQVGSQCRSNEAIQGAFQFAKDGGVGEIKLTRGLCYKRRKSIGALGEYKVPETVDYNLWSGPAPIVDPPTRPNFHYDWHWQRLYGNGDLGNQGPHQTDIARTLLGVEDFPTSVISYGGRLGYQAERQDDNYVDAGDTANTEVSIYNYADGKTLVFETRGLETEDYRGAKIGVVAYGAEGYVVQVNYGYCVAYDLEGNVIKEFKGGRDLNHFRNFLDAVKNDDYASLNADARCGHLSAALSHLGNISYYLGEENKVSPDEAKKVLEAVPGNDDNVETLGRTLAHLQKNGVDLAKTPISMGRMLKIDPKTESFVDDAEAKAMETREYRGEFVVPTADKV
ncbi:MAG: Gfo/Idh/MocA family oxidoreductase [Thermoguttaceae bacterium]|nr:Gfo/Idh/MocA family oxidoreductase [Thermoguttaceae bacterium]